MLGLRAPIVKLATPPMPGNLETTVGSDYHEATKHSYASVRNNPHSLDFSNQPLPFKIYPGPEPARMPTEVRQTGVAALSAIAANVPALTSIEPNAALDLEAVAQV